MFNYTPRNGTFRSVLQITGVCTEIPKELLEKTDIVVCNYRGLSHFPQAVGLLELRLARNQLTRLDGLENLVNLQTLDLARNQLTLFPEQKLECLHYLDLSHNLIAEFPKTKQLPNLSTLCLNSNRISTINKIQLGTVDYLDLGNNQLHHIGSIKAKEIQSLLLSKNRLTRLPRLEHLGIRVFYVRKNKLIRIPKLPQLTTLVADGNPLTCLPTMSNLEFALCDLLSVSFINRHYCTLQTKVAELTKINQPNFGHLSCIE